jgi:hypothetical protein
MFHVQDIIVSNPDIYIILHQFIFLSLEEKGFLGSKGTLIITPSFPGSIIQLPLFIIYPPIIDFQSLPSTTPYAGGRSTTIILKNVVIWGDDVTRKITLWHGVNHNK